jgi:hypothetical protein
VLELTEAELLYQAELSLNWVHEFITESNKIDPQPELSEPGTWLYDGHRFAVIYAIKMAAEGRYALPNAVHKLLLGDHPLSGKLRQRELKIGLNPVVKVSRVPYYMWRWNHSVQSTIDSLRKPGKEYIEPDPDFKTSKIWALHCEFENTHPYELYNGKVGRVLMLNHALLVDIDPWIISLEGREPYFDLIRNHPSASWGIVDSEEVENDG